MYRHRILAVALLFAAGAVSAQTTSQDWDNRVYVSPMGGAIFAGSGNASFGPHGSLAVGFPILPYQALEIEGGYDDLNVSHLPAENKYRRLFLGINALQYLTPDQSTIRPYLLLNANGHEIHFLGQSFPSLGVGAGAGAFLKLSSAWDLRLEGRYNLDFINQRGTAGTSNYIQSQTFYMWTAGFGFRYKFGADPYDEDGDGVPNSRDKCPHTPHGVQVDSNGCPLDSDGDGVPDYLDKCPNTPRGAPVDANGCPLDSDGDGVPDYLDKCPNTPKGVQVDKDGCPLPSAMQQHPAPKCPPPPAGVQVDENGCPLDSDGDGIPDYLDECPHTPKGAKVLPNGCALKGDCRTPRPGEAVDKNGCALSHNFILKGVKFEFDSARLTQQAQLILNEVAETLKAYPDVDVDVEGHTDSIGTDAYNLALSERRAIAVKTYLIAHGVDGKHMTPVGYGKTRPVASNATPEGREENRRVELHVKE